MAVLRPTSRCLALLAAVLLSGTVVASAQVEEAAAVFKSTEDFAPSEQYNRVVDPTLGPAHLEDLPGFTRSVVRPNYALITPESQVWAPLPGWRNTQAAYVITPALGAHFSMALIKMEGNASSALPSPGVERLIFIVQGQATLSLSGSNSQQLKEDSFVYVSPSEWHSLSTDSGASAVVVCVERMYAPAAEASHPAVVVGSTDEQPVVPVPGETFVLRKLLPTGPQHDFNIHIMDFMPGEFLNVKEVHYNQHGLLLLEGRGIYRLADDWYPVQAGDVIWMGPFVPQWYAALGKTRSRYFLYKDTSRDPLFH